MFKMIDMVPAASEVILRPPIFVWKGQPCPVWNDSMLRVYRGNFFCFIDKPGASSLQSHFEATRGHFRVDMNGRRCPVWNGRSCPVWNGSLLWAYRRTFDAENDKPGHGSLRCHFEAAQSRFLRLKALF